MSRLIDLWTLDLTRPPDIDVLSPDERARAGRLLVPQVRRRFMASRAGLREILSRVTGIHPAALTFGTGEHGKPYLLGIAKAPHFNLSHCGDLALVAVSDTPVGVDIEKIQPLDVMEQMSGIAFTENELAAFALLEGDLRTAAFYRLWTRKEALTKADGRGFRMIKTFDVPAHTFTAETDSFIQIGDYAVCDAAAAAGFAAAVAAWGPEGQGIHLRLR